MSDKSALLAKVDIFTCLDAESLNQLSASMHEHEAAADKAIVTQDEIGSSLFIVEAGYLFVTIHEDGQDVQVGKLEPGDFFGEMSLLTGAPRSATVTTNSDVALIEITKADLEPVMQAHPELATRMGHTLCERQSSNLKMLMELASPDEAPAKESLAAQLSYKIRRFFDLKITTWGKAVDGIEEISLFGPLGALLGSLGDTKPAPEENSGAEDKQVAFTTAVIILAAKIAAAGGSYSQKEIVHLKKAFAIPEDEIPNVTRIYDQALGTHKNFEPYAEQIQTMFEDDIAIKEELIGILLATAEDEDEIVEPKKNLIRQIAALFDFDETTYERLIAIHQNREKDAGSFGAEDIFQILAISTSASPEEIKLAYRNVVRDSHPDKLIAAGMPQEFIDQANQKLAVVNAAYDTYLELNPA